jgi:hypothetical protein
MDGWRYAPKSSNALLTAFSVTHFLNETGINVLLYPFQLHYPS